MRLRLFDLALALGACCSLVVLAMELAIPRIPLAQQYAVLEESTGAGDTSPLSNDSPTTVTALLPHDNADVSAEGDSRPGAAEGVVATPSPDPEPTRVADADLAGARETPAAATTPPDPQPSLPSGVTRHAVPGHDEDRALELLDHMNNERLDRGLGMLERNADLDEVALARARDLVANGYFDHYAPDGRSAFTELAARGLPYRLAGENLARNNYAPNRTVDAAFAGLMASPGHRANILEPRFAAVGIAVVQDGRMWYYVTVFTNPR